MHQLFNVIDNTDLDEDEGEAEVEDEDEDEDVGETQGEDEGVQEFDNEGDDEVDNPLLMAGTQRRITKQTHYGTASSITFDGPLSRK